MQASERNYGVATRDDVAGMTGLEVMQAIIEGRLPAPPMARTMSFDAVEVAEGRAVFEGDPGEHLLNPFGVVHGGWALTLIDSVTGCAAHTVLPAGVGYTTIETKVNFTRAVTPDMGKVRAEGRVVAKGRTIISAEGRILDSRGRLMAHGTSTLMVLVPQKAEAHRMA